MLLATGRVCGLTMPKMKCLEGDELLEIFFGLVDVSSPLPLSLDHLHPRSPAATLPTSALPALPLCRTSTWTCPKVLNLPLASLTKEMPCDGRPTLQIRTQDACDLQCFG